VFFGFIDFPSFMALNAFILGIYAITEQCQVIAAQYLDNISASTL